MNQIKPLDHHRTSKTFIACLIISLMILSPLAPMASGAPRFTKRVDRAPNAEPNAPATAPAAAPFVPDITATKVDSFPDADTDGKAAPGETITYDVNITNNGDDATGVNFSDTIDPNTTLVGGSLKVSPLAFADTYVAAQNTALSVGAPGVLTNDTGIPAPTAVAIAGGATAQGGTVTLNTDGSFLYNPAVGFTGTDTFNYTATNGLTPNDTAQVTITVDAPPSVTATTPTNGATNQATDTNISITFSEPVNVAGDWFQIVCTDSGTRNVADTVVGGGPTTFTIDPNTNFSPQETCTVTVFAAQVSDQDANDPPDNMAANFVFSFVTADAAPTVTATTPTDGATNQLTNTDITITFSEPVNVGATWFTINCPTSGNRAVSDTVVTPNGTNDIFTINPNADFAAGETCTVTIVAAQVTDQDTSDPPDNMAANFVFSFTMDAAPAVTTTNPTNGATQIAANTNITINFSENVNIQDATAFTVECPVATPIAFTVTPLAPGGTNSFTLDPNSDLPFGTTCTVTVVASKVTDVDAGDPPDNMLANFVFSFTTDAAPSVTTTVPVNNTSNVAQNATVTINFSESVNVAAGGVTINCGSAVGFTPALPQNGVTSLVLTPTGGGFPAGSNCTVTVVAALVTDADSADPPDNMVSDHVFTFRVKPDAVNDTYPVTLVGNISTNSFLIPFSITTNDVSANAFTITAVQAVTTIVTNQITAASANGGTIVMTVSGADRGKFTYDPPAGFEGSDTFSYTISRDDGGGTDTATVTIPISGMVWFINNTATSCVVAGCGRLSNPFSTLAAFNTLNNGTGNNPAAGDNIFIFTGSGNYTGPLNLLNNQRVIGQGAQQSVTAITGLTPPTGSPSFPATGGTKPPITSAAIGINLASGNQLFGLAFSGTGGDAIRGAVNIGTATINDVAINNTSGGGIILTNGGTITIGGTNTIVTTTGTALNVTNTTIGSGNITFQSISSSGGTGNGIILDTTGSLGGLNVTGDGVNTSVGGNASGGTIANKSGADNNNAQGIGIFLNNTSNVVLRRMTINGTNQNYGIRGLSVNNFTLEYSTVNGTNGTAASLAAPNTAGEGSVYFGNLTSTGMTGSGTITNCIFGGGRHRNFSLINTSGTLNRLTITGSTFQLNQSFAGATGESFSVEARNNGTILNTTVRSSTFAGAPGDLVEWVAQSGTTMDIVFGGAGTGNTMSNNHPQNVIGGGGMTVASAGAMTFNISNNTMRDANGSAVTFQMAAPLAGSNEARSLNGTFNANTIGVQAVVGSGSLTANGIFLSLADNQTAPKSQATIALTNNTIRRYNGNAAIFADNTGGNYDANLTITGNTADNPGPTIFAGVVVTAGALSSTDDIDVCANISGNNFSAAGNGGVADIIVGVSTAASTLRLPGLTTPATQAQIEAFVLGNNNVGGTTVFAFADAPATFAANFLGGAACTSPSAMALPVNSSWRDNLALKREVNRTAPQTLSHHAKIVKSVKPAVVAPLPRSIEKATRTVSSTVVTPKVNKSVSRQQVNATQDKAPRRGISVRPRVAPLAGETVSHSIGTLAAGKTVHIQFQVTVNSPYEGGEFVSNQGTVSGSNFSDVLTDDPAVGGANDPTTTPILQTPIVSVANAEANEPASGSVPMLFTISLSAPAGPSGASVQYETADQPPAIDHAVAGVDYTAVPLTTLNFGPGDQFKTVTVDILADTVAGEGPETFELILSNPTNAIIVGSGTAIGTIKQGNAAGTFLITEIRTSGPGGAGDDFVEVYNNSDSPLTIAASDASAGYGLFKMGADCNAAPILIGTIPNGTVIPARGHYLFVGSAYSLTNYGGTGAAAGNLTLSSDIESDANVAIFNTSLVANLSTVTRLDAVGFGANTGGICDLLREGTTLPPLSGSTLQHSYVRDECGKKGNPAQFGLCPTGGAVVDTNVNNNDFIFVDTTAAATVAGQRLGAPGPQNLSNPIVRNSTITALLLDSNFGGPAPPNRVRDLTPVTNGANGTLSVRRRLVNNTGAEVTRLRFRIVDFSSISVPGGIADLRALTSTNVTVTGVTDTATCAASGTPATPPCSVTVFGTTLEEPPTQAIGGAHNSSLSAGTITLPTPLAPGQSINLQFVLGVQQTGSFKFFFNIEALP